MHKTTKNSLESIQFLRFVAAFIVLFAHVELYEFRTVGIPGNMFAFGGYGVDIFFVISGFIMVTVTRNIGNDTLVAALTFFARRLARVMPLYLLFTLIYVGISYLYFWFPIDHNTSVELYFGAQKRDWKYILDSITFSNLDVAPVFTVGWTLQFEFWFYFLFAVAIASRANLYAFFLGYGLIILGMNWFGYEKHNAAMATIFSPLMFEFLLGIFLYPVWNWTKRFQGNAWFTFTLIMLSGFFFLSDIDPNSYVWLTGHSRKSALAGSASFFMVFFFLSLEGRFKPNKQFVFLGNASYSLYLAHWLCMSITPFVFWKFAWFPSGSMAIYVFVVVLVATSFGVLVHIMVENPLNKALKPKLLALEALLTRSLGRRVIGSR